MSFRSPKATLTVALGKKRLLPVLKSGHPANDVCGSCWAHRTCMGLVLSGSGPTTCCIYDYAKVNTTYTVGELVSHTCDYACVQRQQWEHDKVPHDASYCENHCPMSQFLLDKPPSSYEPDES